MFYRTLKSLTDTEIPVDTGDFRLLDRQVNEALKKLPERNRYVRGLVSWVGFPQTGVEFVRHERAAGETKYTLKKMFKLAGDGIISFSYKPLKMATGLGGIICALSFLGFLAYLIWGIASGMGIGLTASLCFSILFTNGLMMLVAGIFGQYLSRLYDEVKGRPMYVISDMVNF
jgi:dolichol-phosphate mannosyltransferase